MDSKIIEETSKNILIGEILRYPECLDQYISSNDRTPSWDGYIYIYNNIKHTTKSYVGKIEIQLKGKKVKKLSNGKIKYPFDVETLNVYRKSPLGTLLIVVEFVDVDSYKLYYANLLPVDLIEIFTKIKKNQITKQIELNPIVPKSAASLRNICLNFLKNSNKQPNRRLIVEDEMSKVEEINFEIISEKEYFNDYIKNMPIYSYGIIKDTKEIVNMPILKDIRLYTGTTRRISLNDEDITFDIVHSESTNDDDIFIGKSFRLCLNSHQAKVKLSGTLENRLKDIKLIKSILTNQNIIIDGNKVALPFTNELEIKKALSTIEKDFLYYTKILEMFKAFNINFDLNLDLLSDKASKNINILLSLTEGKNLGLLKEYKIYNIPIDQYNILIIPKIENGKMIGIFNLFEKNKGQIMFFTKDEEGNAIPTSLYYSLSPEFIHNASNYNDEVVYEDAIKYLDNSFNEGLCNQLALNLIKVYDDTLDEKYLDTANNLLLEIMEKSSQCIYKLNYYQIKYRRNEINDDLKTIVQDIYDNGNAFIKCGSSVLLNNISEFEKNYKLLNKEEKNVLDNSPMHYLYKKQKDALCSVKN